MKTKILTVAILLILASLLLVSCDKALELDAPTNIRYDGSHITWNAVENAESYTVQINNGEAYTVNSPLYPYEANGATFSVTVTAVSEAKKLIKSSETKVDFKPLGSIESVRVSDDGVLSWDVVNHATAYTLKVDGVEQPGAITGTTYSGLPVGRHSVQVRPVIDGDTSYYSSWSNAVVVELLGTVAKDDITYDNGYIKWKYVSGAQYYEVSVNGVPLDSKCTGTQIEYDPNNTGFEVTVKAIGNHSSTFDGKVSDAKKFVFLDTVTNIMVEDGILTWDPINGASGYKIKLNGSVYAQTLTECKFDKLSADVTTDVSIMPISNDSTYFSSWSDVKSVLILSAPVIRWNDYELDGQANSNVYWDGIANAAGYAVRLTLPDGSTLVETYGETQRYFQQAYLQVGTYLVEVKALANTTTSNTYDSIYSAPIKVVRLAAPKAAGTNYITSNPNDLDDGFTVTFDKVAGATQYRLYKDNVLDRTISGNNNQFVVKDLAAAGVIEEQTYNFAIQSVGSVQMVNGQIVATLSSLTSESHKFSITVLATPAMPNIEGYVYSYGMVNKAAGYVIDVGGQSFSSGETSYELSMLEAGVYNISVCAKGNGANVLPSNYSAPISVHRLEAPTNVRIDTSEASEGVLTFNPVLYASGYYIVFNNDGNPIPVDTISNMNQYITEQGTTVYLQSSANYFNTDRTVYYMTSKPGTTTNFIKLAAPTFGDVAFNRNQLIWKAPSNVNSQTYTPTYEVYYPNGMIYNGEKNGTTMDISHLEGGRSYEFQIKAIGNGTNYINSNKSAVVTIYKLATPEVSRVDGAYTWRGVAEAVSYAIYIDGELMETFVHEPGKTYSYVPKFTQLKVYTVEVVAIGDGGYRSIDSSPCVIKQETKQLQTPDFSLSYSHASYTESGTVDVTITKFSPYAKGYAYTVGGATYEKTETTYSYCPNSVGVVVARVYALGGNFDENGVYYLDSQSVGGNSRYSITLLASPDPASFTLTADGLLKWPAISGTGKYELEISADGVLTTIVVSGASYDLNKSGIDVSKVSTLIVRVRAVGNGIDTITSAQAEKRWDL